ncbi:MAG: histone deacetylase [Acidobacteriota bacterium]
MAECRVVFSPHYDLKAYGLEKLHPFDGRKYGKAWALLKETFGGELKRRHVKVDRQIRRDELARVHGGPYLESLKKPAVLAEALELPPLAKVPAPFLERVLLRPMRWATRGTVLAAEAALVSGAAVNLGGGFHHAKRDRGEGFTIFSDVAIAVELLADAGRFTRQGGPQVGVIDLDAHQSNGPKSIFAGDPRVAFLDFFNGDIYPYERFSAPAPNLDVELRSGTSTDEYLARLREALPAFLEAAGALELVIYIAGTDIYEHDPLGALKVSADGVVERDLLVADALSEAGIPWILVTAGGYTEASHRLIATAVTEMLRRWPGS